MIRFHNGHEFDFGASSGALAFDGDGWFWEWPLRWAGLLRPAEFTVITKTLTYRPRRGNFRWYAPWRTVALVPGGAVNAMALPNPGYRWWLSRPYRHCVRRGYKVMPSIAPFTVWEAERMASDLNAAHDIVGVQVNLSCPNVAHGDVRDIARAVAENCQHPVTFKLAYTDDLVDTCRALDPIADAIELINSVPTHKVLGQSPLSKYGYEGGLSGRPIARLAVDALCRVRQAVTAPIISGGGVYSDEDVAERFAAGASAVVFGSLFLRNPLEPNRIVARWRSRTH